MEDFVNKFIKFILFLVDAIKGMVAHLTGRDTAPTEVSTTEPASE